jgi:hypothetical protein
MQSVALHIVDCCQTILFGAPRMAVPVAAEHRGGAHQQQCIAQLSTLLLLPCHTCPVLPSPPAAAAGPIAPLSIELEFKKPTLLPNKLTLSGDSKAFAKDAAAGEQSQFSSY